MSLHLLPILRGLLADADGLPRVRLGTSVDASAPTLSAPTTAAAAELTAALRTELARLPGRIDRLNLAGLGTVEVLRDVRPGRACRRVCLVTGAAQGFGYEIAADLAREGAWVALTDINAAGAAAAAARLNAAAGADVAAGIAINVADPASVTAAFEQVVSAFGGLDLLVSNAGVLKAGSVRTQSAADFDFVTNVNYKGFFLCVQAAANIMAPQHAACPERWFDIVQINSKSGLQGSNRNGAYAGSKFGGIGLVQSFAMELVADGIKVNAICPGNFFDGPLWSDPRNGLFVQYLHTGKVPGARTVEDVRRFYEAKVPMGRGCTAPDVMKALYYLTEQVYETGQALPVTGGQVMLK